MEKLVEVLIKNNITITTMESCTGGGFISAITNIPGSSAITEGGFVTYSNNAKVLVGVRKETIEKFGVYSQETAIEMALVCSKNLGSNIGIGITGSLGNIDQANEDSVVNQVHYAIAQDGHVKVVKTINVVEGDNRLEQKQIVINEIKIELFYLVKKDA